ncbi:MAG: exonuclease domain-containing protein [Maribacter sp.]
MYTIIDIETTGNGIKGNKITEISIFKYDGHEIVDEFTSLVNPMAEIPAFITGLTGIDNAMVRNAPTFNEIAESIEEITRDTIFVAHNVNFDYNVLKNEFQGIHLNFTRKKLCSVRLSRTLLPGYHSYSLGKLTAALGIPLTDRHRARGDAHATVLLFHKLLRAPKAPEVFKAFLNARSQEGTLPPALPREEYEKLPNTPGVYYFKNGKGKIIYVGKAINIKKRVLSHFYDKKTKEVQLCAETAYLDFEETGNELIALLKESAEIKHHFPKHNRAQKKSIQQYGIFSYQDRTGIQHLAFNKLKMAPAPLAICYSVTEARHYLETLCATFELCPKYCHLQEQVTHCSHYKIKQCIGICSDATKVDAYNARVSTALDSLRRLRSDLVIRLKGRNIAEHAVVLVRENTYVGYGYVPNDTPIVQVDDIETFITPQKNTLETQRIVESYVRKYPKNVISFEQEASY